MLTIPNTVKITNGKLILSDRICEANLYIQKGKILAVTEEDLPCDMTIDAKGSYVSPGFIDTHVHGGGGHDFMDGGQECAAAAARAHMKHGTTTILPTTLSDSLDEIIACIKDVYQASKEERMPHIPGVHLEGPFLAKTQAGAMNPKYIIEPVKEDYEKLIDAVPGFVKKVTFAPELPGSMELCKYLKEKGIIASAGHTEATLDDMEACRKEGLNMVTHLYSAMSTITRRGGFRVLGVIESAYYYDDLYAEVIADGLHLPPTLLKLIYKSLGPDRVCLITDSMRGADMPEGPSILGALKNNFECFIEDGIAKMPDRSCFAGSVATTDRLVRVFKEQVGLPLPEIIRMITRTPAKAHGIEGKGELKEGFDADIVLFDEGINIEKIILSNLETVQIYETGEI